MSDIGPFQIAIGFLAGAGLAAAHFGGLWATLRAMPGLAHPRLAFWSSLALRFGLTLGGFHLLLLAGPGLFFPALLGFLLTRTLASALASRPGRGERDSRIRRRQSSWK